MGREEYRIALLFFLLVIGSTEKDDVILDGSGIVGNDGNRPGSG